MKRIISLLVCGVLLATPGTAQNSRPVQSRSGFALKWKQLMDNPMALQVKTVLPDEVERFPTFGDWQARLFGMVTIFYATLEDCEDEVADLDGWERLLASPVRNRQSPPGVGVDLRQKATERVAALRPVVSHCLSLADDYLRRARDILRPNAKAFDELVGAPP